MDYKLVFKNITRKLKKAEINSFSELQTICSKTFAQTQGIKDLEYFYIDEDEDEIMMISDEDV